MQDTEPDTGTAAAVALSETRLSFPTADGDVSVLCGIDMRIGEGEIVAVTGPSGSGKSSLIAVIAGLEAATGGKVEVLGVDFATAGVFSDWPATVTYYANCMGLE